MTDIDTRLEALGSTNRAVAAASIDIDADLDATLRRPERSPVAVTSATDRSPVRMRWVLSAAAAVAALVVGAAVIGDDDGPRPVDTTNPLTTASPVSTAAPTTTASPDTTATNPTAEPLLPPQEVTVPVSHLDPPPVYEPEAFTTIDVEEFAQFTVGDDLIVALESDGQTIVQLDLVTGTTTQRQLPVVIGEPVLGPENVLYGLAFSAPKDGTQMPVTSIVALSLDTDEISVLASERVDTVTYTEFPQGGLVAGADGIVDVDRARATVMEFAAGTMPEGVQVATPALDADSTQLVTLDGSATWWMSVTADPNAASPFDGPPVAQPGPDGSIRISRFVGARAEREPVDFGTPTQEVIADLRPGAGSWWSLTDGWTNAASSVWGTLLVRQDESTAELAWFDPPAPDALPFRPSAVVASTGDGYSMIVRDSDGVSSEQPIDESYYWPLTCTTEMIDALFAAAPAGATLKSVGCSVDVPSIAAGRFFTGNDTVSIRLVEKESGWTDEVEPNSPLEFRLNNMLMVGFSTFNCPTDFCS